MFWSLVRKEDDMGEIEIKADLRAIRRWLVSISNDEGMPHKDRWLAKQTLNKLNELA